MNYPELYSEAWTHVRNALVVFLSQNTHQNHVGANVVDAGRTADLLVQDLYVDGLTVEENARTLRAALGSRVRSSSGPDAGLALFATEEASTVAVTALEEVYAIPRKRKAAAERVRAFLAERTRAHRDTEEVYSLGGMDGVVVLDHGDLEELVRSVLGPDVDLGTESPSKARGRAASARALNKALQGRDILAGEARSISRLEAEQGGGE